MKKKCNLKFRNNIGRKFFLSNFICNKGNTNLQTFFFYFDTLIYKKKFNKKIFYKIIIITLRNKHTLSSIRKTEQELQF